MEFLRAVYRRSYNEEVVTDLLSHLAVSSLRQYESSWKRFQNWLADKPETISSSVVASFLVHCSKGLSARTVLTIRAALALPLLEGLGIDLDHRHFHMLAKAAFRKKPPMTRVVPSWSLDEALEVLAKIPQESLGPREILYKAIFLTAVASSNRSSELAAIDRERIELRQSSIVLPVKPGFLFKNQGQFHSPTLIEIPDLPGSPLCPVKALRDYLDATQGRSETSLFLHPVSSKPLNAGRLAFFLAKAIDWLLPGCLAEAHDTRRLSTTLAFMSGVTIGNIVAAASWRSTNTFTSRYLVPIRNARSSARAVIARSRI